MRGLWTALITPFMKGDGVSNSIDYHALEKLLFMQIEAGVDGVLLLGTTGERPTLSQKEAYEYIHFCIDILRGKTKIMVNAGTYSTRDTIHTITDLNAIDDIDAYLIVNPYYNKPTQIGLKKHFILSAQATDRPVFIYNIEGRTSVNLETSTLCEIIAAAKNIIGVKEASGNLKQMKHVIAKTPDDFIVLSGDDSLSFDLIQNGGDGVVSIASNCQPKVIQNFIHACRSGDPSAHDTHEHLQAFFSALSLQTNPLPVKTYLAHIGVIQEQFRLPLCPMDTKNRQKFLDIIDGYCF